MNPRNALSLLAGLGGILILGGIIGTAAAKNPGQRPEPNALEQGDVKESIKIFSALYEDLKSHNFDVKKVALQKYRLPDQDLTEYAANRDRNTVVIYLPNAMTPEYKNLAFYTDIYVRLNIRHFPNEKNDSRPEGFYLVCWKDGRIQKVPVEKVRILKRPKHDRMQEYLPVFPGMAAYRDNLPMHPAWAVARNKPVPAP